MKAVWSQLLPNCTAAFSQSWNCSWHHCDDNCNSSFWDFTVWCVIFYPNNDSCRGKGQLTSILQCTNSCNFISLRILKNTKKKRDPPPDTLSNYQNFDWWLIIGPLLKSCPWREMLCWLETHRQFPGLSRVVSCCSWTSFPSFISKGVLHCICDEAGKHQQYIQHSCCCRKNYWFIKIKITEYFAVWAWFQSPNWNQCFQQNRDPLSVSSETEVCPRLSPLQERRADL